MRPLLPSLGRSLETPLRSPYIRSLRPRVARPPPHAGPSTFAFRPSSSVAYESTRSRLLRPTTVVLIFVPILTGFLGFWQVKRLRWKVALIDEVDRNLAREPMALPARINLSALPEFSFRRVVVSGIVSSPPILLGPQVKDGVPGYALIQPLDRPNGTAILLNRGFITTTRAANIRAGRELPPGIAPDGGGEEVRVEGMLLRPGEKGFWTPENNVSGNEWFWRDVPGMAEYVRAARGDGAKEVQEVLVDAIDYGEHPSSYLMQQGIPVGRPAQIELRNQHASYAVTCPKTIPPAIQDRNAPAQTQVLALRRDFRHALLRSPTR